MPLVDSLRWVDVNPSLIDFDRATVDRVARQVILEAVGGDCSRLEPLIERRDVEPTLDRALIAACGVWVAGWRWTANGPICQWCCPNHSLFRKDDADALVSAQRAVAAVDEWHAFLLELKGRFAEIERDTKDLPLESVAEYGASSLLPLVVERTGTEDAWYACFSQILGWFLESVGYEAERVATVIEEVVSGHFESWTEPSAQTATAAFEEIARQLAVVVSDDNDALADWLVTRSSAFGGPLYVKVHQPVRQDGHLAFIEGFEHRRDPVRAQRMKVALAQCRASADRGEALSFELLSAWQSLVLGVPDVGFRTGEAFGKRGRERYGFTDKTRERFLVCLAEANNGATPVAVRAARVYLDICFFHPFADGNSRAARLALDHVLRREGQMLHAVDPLFVVSRAAKDRRGAVFFVYLVDYLAGPGENPRSLL